MTVLSLRLPRRLGNLTRSTQVLLAVIAAGLAISIWSRARIDALLAVDDGAALRLAVEAIDGDCGTPSIYLLPRQDGDSSDYRLLIDFLGGANRFPMLGGGGTEAVLTLPSSRPPGIGLGRGLPASCNAMRMTITGEFAGHGDAGSFPGIGRMNFGDTPDVVLSQTGPGKVTLAYGRADQAGGSSALGAVALTGIFDRWQEGARRVAFINDGVRDINVFFYEEPGYQFINEQNSLVRPIGTRRAYADAHLAGTGDTADNTVVVYRRRPASDIELQHELIGVSTIFGIGISLLIEGLLVLVTSFAAPHHREAAPVRKGATA